MSRGFCRASPKGRKLLISGALLRVRLSGVCQSDSVPAFFRNRADEFLQEKSVRWHAETQNHTCKFVASGTVTNVTGLPLIFWTESASMTSLRVGGSSGRQAMTKMLYIGQGRRRPKGWLLAHNRILHGKNTRNGVNGFRYFWIASREGGWKLCRCGWRPDLGPHYSKNPKRELLKRVRE